MRITRLHHAQITIPVGEESNARAFYCNLLGLKEIPKPERLQSRGGLWLELDGQEIHIGVEEKISNSSTKAHLAYQVEDIGIFRNLLSSAGFSILPGEPIPGYEGFETRDPFGNRLEFIQPLS